MTTLRAYAKLNLTLDVLGKRPDGYHELDMIMLRASLFDTLSFTPSPELAVSYKNIPMPEGDLVRRAIEAYAGASGALNKARISVYKRIPAEAGLGGGSADAAAVLLAMQAHYRALTDTALCALALRLGADVPFCMQMCACRARGVGEALTPLYTHGQLWFLIVKPETGLSTQRLFSSLLLPPAHRPDTDAAARALAAHDLDALGPLMINALQAPAVQALPEIDALCARLLFAGAKGACMTGSGSAVIGLFHSRALAREAAMRFKDAAFCAVVKSLSV